MRFELDTEHRIAEGDTLDGLVGESYLDAGLIRVDYQRTNPDGRVAVRVSGEAPVILDWLLNHWSSVEGGSPAAWDRLQAAVAAMHYARPARS